MIVEVMTSDAITELKVNRKKHLVEYEMQLKGWKEAYEQYSNDLKTWSADGGSAKRPSEPHKPHSYEEDYDHLIKKLGRHIHETIELNDHEYDQIFENKFGWRSGFINSSTIYSASIDEAKIRNITADNI